MATKNKRFMLTLTDDIETDVKRLKKTQFYDKPYSELYRQLIKLGIKNFDSKADKSN